MSWRGGRGRGWGRGGGGYWGYRRDNQKAFVPFPDDIVLPDVPDFALQSDNKKINPKDRDLLVLAVKMRTLSTFWKESPYYLQTNTDMNKKKIETDFDIERYSDLINKKKNKEKEQLSDYLLLQQGHFPDELIEGIIINNKERKKSAKKLKWGFGSNNDDKMFDKMAKNEKLSEMRAALAGENDSDEESSDEEEEGKKKKRKKGDDGEQEEEDDNDGEEVEEESSDEGDYDYKFDFDDDDDGADDLDDSEFDPIEDNTY